MRIVVTGLSGNLGTALLRRLAAHGAGRPGGHEVVGVCRRPPSGGEPYHLAEWVAADLADPSAPAVLREVMAGADAVVHLAWDFQPSHDTAYLERTAVGGTRAVVTAADLAGVAHLVHLSSLGVYARGPEGPPGTPRSRRPRVDETYPHGGVPTLAYSRHKAAAEGILDTYEAGDGRRGRRRTTVTRLRPGLVMQHAAGGAIDRYAFPPWLPGAALRALPALPLDRGLAVQGVHSDDVAAAVTAVLEQQAGGAFNLAAEPVITRDDIAAALGARPLHLPAPVLRAATWASWHARLQPLDPGWLDLAFAAPLMDTTRAREVLGWRPAVDSRAALDDLLAGMAGQAGTASPALRPRRVADDLSRAVRRGPVSHRRLP